MHYFPFKHKHKLTKHEFLGCCKDCERSHRLVKKHLCDFHNRIINYSPTALRKLTPAKLYQLYLVLDDIAHLDCGNNLAEMILADPDINGLLPTIRSYYTTFFDLHETALAQEVLAAADPWHPLEIFGLYPRYVTLIRTQIEALDLPRPKRLVFIGCGPVPLSLILFNCFYGINSIGLDSDPQAVSLARQCLERLGLSEAIKIIRGDQESLADIDWDLVLVAALAEPKAKIFSSLLSFRLYEKGLRRLLDLDGDFILPPKFSNYCRIPPQPPVNNTVVVVKIGAHPKTAQCS